MPLITCPSTLVSRRTCEDGNAARDCSRASSHAGLVPRFHLGTRICPKLCLARLRAPELKLRQQGLSKWNLGTRVRRDRNCEHTIELKHSTYLVTPHTPTFMPPPGYARIKVVESFDELVSTRFGAGINSLCWPRDLPGDFDEVVQQLTTSGEITTLDEASLKTLPVSAAGRAAIENLIEDQRLLRAAGLAPILDCIHAYPREEKPGPVPIDVYSFHADSATMEADTWLCSYNESSSEGLRNDEARRRIDIPETRAELLKLFGGEENEDFREHLEENCYNLHYAPVPGARPFSFGIGNLWRIAVDYPGSPVPPCIHRAPAALPGRPPRLLLIS